ncbi:MAG: VWA domain-containing protein [Cyanobacteria bacterium TGS_CYA1]|nr:VWA domain-containing protein [Cyanobacteria bacterium TGS_CYA1]
MRKIFGLALSLGILTLQAPMAEATGFLYVDSAFHSLPNVRIPILPTNPRDPQTRPLLQGSVQTGVYLDAQDIKVDIFDQVAKTYIKQTFKNDTDKVLSGTYLFPLPDDATFSSFSLHIDGKPVEGKILEKAEATAQYEAIVRKMIDPGLLEYADYKTVRARIYPIPAHGSKTVELEYTQLLKSNGGIVSYKYPLRATNKDAVSETNLNVSIKGKQGIRTIWSPTHHISMTRKNEHQATVTFNEKNGTDEKDFLLSYVLSASELATNLQSHKKDGEDGYFLLAISPPIANKAAVAKDIVVVADTSGSMAGEWLEQSKKSLKYIVNSLNAGDRFNIVQFNTDADAFEDRLLEATKENKAKAISYIDDLEAHGGTNLADAVSLGSSMFQSASKRPSYMIMMTDGEPTVGKTGHKEIALLLASKPDMRVFNLGIGYDINTQLLDKIASNHHGTAQFVEPGENLETALSGLYDKIRNPIMSDVKISYEGITVKDVYPRSVKDMFANTQVMLVGKYKGSGEAKIKIAGTVNGAVKNFQFPLSFPEKELQANYLPRLWAMRRVGHLTEVAKENGNTQEIVDEIMALSRKHGIVTAYSSYLVTEPTGTAMVNNRPQPVPMPMEASARGGFARRSFVGSPTGAGAAGSAKSSRIAFAQAAAPSLPSTSMGRATASQASDNMYMASDERRKDAGARQLLSMMADKEETGEKAVLFKKVQSKLKTDTYVEGDGSSISETKIVDDKTFRLKNGSWVDDALAVFKGKTEKVEFASKRYFDLLKEYPGIAKYLAVGKSVTLVFKGTCFKITGGEA